MFKPGDRVICIHTEIYDDYIEVNKSYEVKSVFYTSNLYTKDDEKSCILLLENCEGEIYYNYQFIIDNKKMRKEKLKKLKKISNKLNFKFLNN